MTSEFHVGIDGCPAGWVAASRENRSGPARIAVFETLDALLDTFKAAAHIAIDMPIGLPDTITGPGRGPEQALRPHLGARQSSVFSIPARSAVEAATYADACRNALETSDPPRKVSKQSYNIFPKIRELDRILRRDQNARTIVFECHPEGVFWRLNGRTALSTPKKLRDPDPPRVNAERRQILTQAGVLPEAWRIRGAGSDDILDACACLAAAEDASRGGTVTFPESPDHDAFGLPIRIVV